MERIERKQHLEDSQGFGGICNFFGLKRWSGLTSVGLAGTGVSFNFSLHPDEALMKRLSLLFVLAFAAVLAAENASAQYPANTGFLPFGFYQPYGATYSSSIRTPPYFATNPPVYYGARHERPYGLSPFASPPLLSPGDDYRSRLRLQFQQPVVPTPPPTCNPCVSQSPAAAVLTAAAQDNAKKMDTIGPVRSNPFVEDRIAKN
jgi:hypothetical protein